MRIIVAVSGATGVEMSYYLVKALKSIKDCEVHLVISKSARITWSLESEIPIEHLEEAASFVTDGMIVMPCSMKTLAGIAAGYDENLIVRAADVCMKEGRKVVLVPREMPLGKVHLRNMKEVADLGCTLVPPMLTFYNGPKTLVDQINHIVGKVLLQFGITYDKFVPWKGIEN